MLGSAHSSGAGLSGVSAVLVGVVDGREADKWPPQEDFRVSDIRGLDDLFSAEDRGKQVVGRRLIYHS